MAVRKINKLLVSTVAGCLCNSAVWAAEIDMNTAQMQAMDKITGRVSIINVPVNTDVKFGSFSIVVRACKTRPPEDTPENFAFADIVDSYNNEQPMNIFRGWMMSSTPGLNAVEHPIYDVWLLKCINTEVDKSKLMSPEQLKDRDGIVRAPQITEREEYKSPELPPENRLLLKGIEAELENKELTDMPVAEAIEEDMAEKQPTDEQVLVSPDITEKEDGAPTSLLNIGGMQDQPSAEGENKPDGILVDSGEKEVEKDIDLFEEDDTLEATDDVAPSESEESQENPVSDEQEDEQLIIFEE